MKNIDEILQAHEKWLRCEPGGVRADLRDANLYGANLEGADLRGADLCEADLREVNFEGADLRGADLRGADLWGAKFKGADLWRTYLEGADLQGAKNVPYVPMACPSDGAFVGWKKVQNGHEYLIKLQIPEDAKRSSATSRKCRCDKALVLEITDLNSGDYLTEVKNNNFCTTIYKVGEIVLPDEWDNDRFNECSHGIHFFINKEEALRY